MSWFGIAKLMRSTTSSRLIAYGGSFIASLMVFSIVALIAQALTPGNPKIPKNYQPVTAIQNVAPIEPNKSTLTVTEFEYGSTWSFPVPILELECHDNSVTIHTSKGIYALNGQAMETTPYPDAWELALPDPKYGDVGAKMSPPPGLIQRGLDLCEHNK